MVFSLYNDGEITMEKGGSAYGWRSIHTVKQPLFTIPPPFVFPVVVNSYTMAIMTKEECEIMRERMRLCVTN